MFEAQCCFLLFVPYIVFLSTEVNAPYVPLNGQTAEDPFPLNGIFAILESSGCSMLL